jgi:hypothetical protein
MKPNRITMNLTQSYKHCTKLQKQNERPNYRQYYLLSQNKIISLDFSYELRWLIFPE